MSNIELLQKLPEGYAKLHALLYSISNIPGDNLQGIEIQYRDESNYAPPSVNIWFNRSWNSVANLHAPIIASMVASMVGKNPPEQLALFAVATSICELESIEIGLHLVNGKPVITIAGIRYERAFSLENNTLRVFLQCIGIDNDTISAIVDNSIPFNALAQNNED